MIYPVEYEAEIYNEIKEKVENVHGVTFANTFSEAMEKIEGYYGDELCSVMLFMLEENEIYEFEMTKEASHGMYRIDTFYKWEK